MKSPWLYVILIGVMLLSACTSPVTISEGDGESVSGNEPESTPAPDTAAPPTSAPSSIPQQPTDVEPPSLDLLPEENPPGLAAQEFSTDFSIHTIPYDEILSGGVPKDAIPAINDPQFVSTDEADSWLEPVEPVIFVEVGDDRRAYPIQILMWHEIVNDTVGDLPLTITFCPLCNTAIVFERVVDGQTLDFGTTGRLHYSNLIMYDRQTESWWEQASGKAVIGSFTGTRLKFHSGSIIAWEEFKATYPDGVVMSQNTGHSRAYGRNPYAGYDDVNRPPFLYDGPETPGILPPVARVLTVESGEEAVAYPFDVLQEVHVVNDEINGIPVVVIWETGVASALDVNTVAGGRDVGTAAVYERTLNGEVLEFEYDGQKIIDVSTQSAWNILGQAVDGALLDAQLTPIVSINHFWFSWAAFMPETRVYQPE
jgi:hypothetical protein